MGTYSPIMPAFIEKLEAFSTNIFSTRLSGSNSASPNQMLNLVLPNKSIINCPSIALKFTVNLSTTGAATKAPRLPNRIDSLFSKIEVKIGGVLIDNGCNFYNLLQHAKEHLTMNKSCPLLEHPEVVRSVSYHNSTGLTGNVETNNTFIISNFDGFLRTLAPQYLDCALCSDLEINFYTADNSVLIEALEDDTFANFVAANSVAGSSYTLTNIVCYFEAIAMGDGSYDAMQKELMNSKGYLELPFKRYQDFQTTTATDVRFNIASQSLDRLWIVHRDANYNTQGAPVRVAGFIQDISASGVNVEYNRIFDYNKEKYISRHFNMPAPSTAMKCQVNINSMNYPQFQGDLHDWVYITKNSLENVDMNYGFRTFINNYCVFCLRLNLVNSEKLRLISGLNTKGINAAGTVNYFNSNSRPIVCFAECTSILKIAPGGITFTEL